MFDTGGKSLLTVPPKRPIVRTSSAQGRSAAFALVTTGWADPTQVQTQTVLGTIGRAVRAALPIVCAGQALLRNAALALPALSRAASCAYRRSRNRPFRNPRRLRNHGDGEDDFDFCGRERLAARRTTIQRREPNLASVRPETPHGGRVRRVFRSKGPIFGRGSAACDTIPTSSGVYSPT